MKRLLLIFVLAGMVQAAAPKGPPQPYGWLDARACHNFYGWAMDRANPGGVKVNLYVDGKYSKSVPANLPRPDVDAAGYGQNRGFEFKLPQRYYDGKPHSFAVRVTGTDWELVNSPIILSCDNMGPAPSATPGATATPPPVPTPSPTAEPSPTPPVEMKNLTLRWNANQEADLAGYRVSYGKAPRQYSESVDVGNVTSTQVTVEVGTPWYFAVSAYNVTSTESQPSAEVIWP